MVTRMRIVQNTKCFNKCISDQLKKDSRMKRRYTFLSLYLTSISIKEHVPLKYENISFPTCSYET